jgi:small-conductance mechanosensitive channel
MTLAGFSIVSTHASTLASGAAGRVLASPLAERIQAEGDAVVGALGALRTWLFLAALLGVLIGSWWLRRWIVRQEPVSLQVRTLATSVISAATLVLALAVTLFYLHRQAPLLTALSLMLLGIIATLSFGVSSHGWIRAVLALWRGRIRVGDSLRIAGSEGRVEDVGLFRVIVETEDGGHMHIPTGRFGREIYAVSSPERVFPVEVHIVVTDRLSEQDLEMLRAIATLSPYRESGSSITIDPGTEPERATVRFRSWSEDGARLARAHLNESFERARGAGG